MERVAALKSSLKWRGGAGHAIVSSVRKAVKLAMEGGGWNNDPVRNAAPNSNLIHEYLQACHLQKSRVLHSRW